MSKGLFVTATGTDVGKTLITAGLLRQLLARGADVAALKPVQTGAGRGPDGRLRAPDLEFVCRAAGWRPDHETLSHMSPYIYEPACSPHLAARLAGESIRLDRIIESARWLAARHEFLLVEGAGGLLVPLNEGETMLDLIAALGLPVLLVAPAGLGAINQVLLSLEALRRRRLPVAGVVLNERHPTPPEERYICDDNARTIAARGAVPVLARVPDLGAPPDLAQLDAALAELSAADRGRPKEFPT